MDHTFAQYLIEDLYMALPMCGIEVALDFADATQRLRYEMDDALRLCIPLAFTTPEGKRREVLAPLCELMDEDHAMEAIQRWIACWQRAIALMTWEEAETLDVALFEEDRISAHASPERLEALILQCDAAYCDAFAPLEGDERLVSLILAGQNDPASPHVRLVTPSRFGRDVNAPPRLELAIWLIGYELAGEQLQVRDIKEQALRLDLALVWAHRHEIEAYFSGWRAAFDAVSARALSQPESEEKLRAALPSDLFFPETMKLKKCVDPESYAAAHEVRSRLGRFLPGA